MNSLILKEASGLPANLEQLAKFALFTREKLTAIKAQIRAMDKLSIALTVREQKNKEAQDVGSTLLDIEVKLGELFQEMEKKQGRTKTERIRSTSGSNSKRDKIRSLGFTDATHTAQRFQLLAKHRDVVAEVKTKTLAAGGIPTRSAVFRAIARKLKTAQAESAPKFMPEPGKYGMRNLLDDYPEVKAEIKKRGRVVIQQTDVDLSARLIREAWCDESIQQLITILETLLKDHQ